MMSKLQVRLPYTGWIVCEDNRPIEWYVHTYVEDMEQEIMLGRCFLRTESSSIYRAQWPVRLCREGI